MRKLLPIQGAWGNYKLYGDCDPRTAKSAASTVAVSVAGFGARVAGKLTGPGKTGIHRLLWDLAGDRAAPEDAQGRPGFRQ